MYEELERIWKEAAGSLWMCCTAIRFEGPWENHEKKLRTFGVPTSIRTLHTLNTSRKLTTCATLLGMLVLLQDCCKHATALTKRLPSGVTEL